MARPASDLLWMGLPYPASVLFLFLVCNIIFYPQILWLLRVSPPALCMGDASFPGGRLGLLPAATTNPAEQCI